MQQPRAASLVFHKAQPTPMPPRLTIQKRDTHEDWHCQRSGDCCKGLDVVLMREEEQAAIQTYADAHLTIQTLNNMHFRPTQTLGFVGLLAGPCPLLGHDGSSHYTCLVYPVRPYNCRRFGCLRPDVKAEPLQMAPIAPVLKYGHVGCVNLRERLLQSRVARRIYEKLQRKAQRWARSHGWSDAL